MANAKKSDPLPDEPGKQPTSSPKSSLEIPFWRQMLLYFLFMFFGILCTHAVSRLHEIGEPIYGMAREAFFVALIVAGIFGVTSWNATNKQ